jgi:hypothetical protein
MTDDELRHILHQAHADDAPPAFPAVLLRRRARPRRPFLLLVPVAAALLLAILWLRRPPAPPASSLARLDLRWSAPTDFLLDIPGGDLLRETPRFDLKGLLP